MIFTRVPLFYSIVTLPKWRLLCVFLRKAKCHASSNFYRLSVILVRLIRTPWLRKRVIATFPIAVPFNNFNLSTKIN